MISFCSIILLLVRYSVPDIDIAVSSPANTNAPTSQYQKESAPDSNSFSSQALRIAIRLRPGLITLLMYSIVCFSVLFSTQCAIMYYLLSIIDNLLYIISSLQALVVHLVSVLVPLTHPPIHNTSHLFLMQIQDLLRVQIRPLQTLGLFHPY